MKILFTSTLNTSFINEDLTILNRHFEVHPLIGRGIPFLFKVVFAVPRADVTYTWFASVYAFVVVFMAKLLRKRSIVALGGVDAARIPEIGYGIWLVPWKAVLVKWVFRNASRIIAVAPSLKQEAARLAGYDGANIEVVPTGYDASFWRSQGPKEPFVLTVAACDDAVRIKVKGIDLLCDAARLLPEVRFVAIGIRLDKGMGLTVPPNVQIVPFLTRAELLQYYQRAKVYCQPSYAEGMPNSLCEAMLCGCIPVVTEVGGMPGTVGSAGFTVPRADAQRLAETLSRALESPLSAGGKARDRIAKEFTQGRREERLLRIICTGSS